MSLFPEVVRNTLPDAVSNHKALHTHVQIFNIHILIFLNPQM